MKNYQRLLDINNTQKAIEFIKDEFKFELCDKLKLTRVSAPLFVRQDLGLNDNLNGYERPVSFDIPDCKCNVEIVHSLAKWKRVALKKYCFQENTGLITDMNAIRRDEVLDHLHSVYVDQWDWEKIISKEQRTIEYLKETVNLIVEAIYNTALKISEKFPVIENSINKEVFFITSQELEDLYPNLSSKERENAICKLHKTIFIIGIGDTNFSGNKHDGRAPDYDDWHLNGDLLFYHQQLDQAIEISSMGIRVDENSLLYQLEKSNNKERLKLEYHQQVLNKQLPLSIGGGIGQSRLCMLLLKMIHIGEVQVSIWNEEMIEECKKNKIELL